MIGLSLGLNRFGTTAPSVAFVPTDITNLDFWVRGDLGTSGVDAAAQSAWNDQSGNARHATQATGGLQPLLRTTGAGLINGLSTLDFDGSDDCMALPNFLTALSAGEIFIVGKIDVDPPAAAGQTGHAAWFGNAGATAHFPFTDGTIYEDFGTNTRKTQSNPTPAMTSPFLYHVQASATHECFLNGTSLAAAVANTVSWTTTPFIGKSNPAGLVAVYAGVIAEVIFYGRTLTAGERSSVKSYVASRYGITVA